MSSYDCLDLCRLCLVKDRVSVPIFEGEGDVRQIFLKITACLPVKVGREDKLPKKICDDCLDKVELLYDFWNITANAEKQLLQWLGEDGDQEKQGYVSNVMNSELMKQETAENRLDTSFMRTEGHQNNMNINMMDQIGLTMPIIMSTDQRQITSVPMTSSASNIQAVPGSSSQSSSRPRKTGNNQEEEEESEEEENSDDECDNEGGSNVKQEVAESARNVEPSFVNVTLACDEAGPSGLQQQKLTEIPGLVLAHAADGDPKSGFRIKEEIVSESEDNMGLRIIDVTSCAKPKKPVVKKKRRRRYSDEPEENREDLKCPLCSKTFKKRNYLNFHITRHSSALACHICDTKFPSNYYLNLHLRRHNKEFAYFCTICNKGFYIKASLDYHMVAHTDEKPFTCDICHKAFGHKVYLNKHMTVHKPPKETKERTCDLCGFVTSRPEYYRRHMRKHTGESKMACTYCGKMITKAYMITHVRTHTGEKTEICEFCGKTFSSKAYVEKHRRVHTGERPFECRICHKRFTQRESVTVHMKIHQRNNENEKA